MNSTHRTTSSTFTIYHNPKCSKSRQALDILQDHGIQPIIIEYLKTPLTLAKIRELRLHFDLKEFIRYQEPVFKEMSLSLDDEDRVLEAILKEPILMQRPIITVGDLAIIARPTDKLADLINKFCTE